ncbi:hypothetical protein PENTCL1PPCAC_16338, partial [Pristionchus entomophagus]
TISIHTFVDSLAVILNVLFLLAIALRTPPNLRSYAVLLMYCTTVDLIAAICSLMIMIRVIPVGVLVAYIYDGPCVALSSFFCHCLYSITLVTFLQSFLLIVVSFAYRLYVLKR